MGVACGFMPEVHAYGALWGRARKVAVSGTGVASVRPDVPKASGQRARYAEVKKNSV